MSVYELNVCKIKLVGSLGLLPLNAQFYAFFPANSKLSAILRLTAPSWGKKDELCSARNALEKVANLSREGTAGGRPVGGGS